MPQASNSQSPLPLMAACRRRRSGRPIEVITTIRETRVEGEETEEEKEEEKEEEEEARAALQRKPGQQMHTQREETLERWLHVR